MCCHPRAQKVTAAALHRRASQAKPPPTPPHPTPPHTHTNSCALVSAIAATPPALRGNWPVFWAAVCRDHSHAGLVWNERCRRELREALSAEEAALRLGRARVADRRATGAGGSALEEPAGAWPAAMPGALLTIYLGALRSTLPRLRSYSHCTAPLVCSRLRPGAAPGLEPHRVPLRLPLTGGAALRGRGLHPAAFGGRRCR